MAAEIFNEIHYIKRLEQLRKEIMSLKDHSDFQFEPYVKGSKQAILRGVIRPTVRDYVKGTPITLDDIDGKETIIPLEKQTYFAFYYDDTDKAQTTYQVTDETLREALQGVAVEQDKYVGNKLKASLTTNKSTSAVALDKDAIRTEIKRGRTLLAKNAFVPQTEAIYLELGPEPYYEMVEFLANIKTDNDELLKNGALSKYLNCYITMETGLPTGQAVGTEYSFMRTKQALAFYETFVKIEQMRGHNQFRTEFRGLSIYGAKVIRPREIYGIEISLSTNFAKLETLIDAAEGLTEADYTASSWSALETGIIAAKLVLADSTKTQSQVNTALGELQAIVDALVSIKELSSLIVVAKELQEADYTSATWTPFATKLSAAEAIEAKSTATKAEVATALGELDTTMKALVLA